MSSVKVRSVNWERVDAVLNEAAVPYVDGATSHSRKDAHAFPGAVLVVGLGGDVIYEKAFGCRSLLPEATPLNEKIVYDVSSLTKVMVTVSLAMHLVEQGLLEVDRRLSRIFQTFSTHGKERMTVRDLLTHSSGYAPTAPFYKQIAKANDAVRCGFMSTRGATEAVYQEIFRAKLEHLPGKVARYSDIGFILLGHAIEVVSGTTIDKLAQKIIFKPLGLASTGYIDLSAVKRRSVQPISDAIAPTNDCAWRKRVLCGEVQDENAWAMGGISGHAGIFSTAADVNAFASELIACYHGRGTLFQKETVRTFWAKDVDSRGDARVPGSTWALGWDTPNKEGSSSGQYFSRNSVGHLGYTGCSLWIDPERELSIVLLSNRVHPSVDNNLIRQVRPRLHDAVMESIGFI